MRIFQMKAALVGLLALSPAVFAATTTTTTVPAATPATTNVTATAADAQKKQMETVVHDYIIKNPEVVVQSLQIFQQNQMDQAQKTMDKTRQLAPKHVTELFHNINDPIVGNPQGKVTLVEFFDYQCPHCTRMNPVLADLAKSNPDLRIVYKEFPIRGPASDVASRAALAAKNQGKYTQLHDALMLAANQAPLTEEIIYNAAGTAGLDLVKLKADMKSPAISNQLKENTKLGQDLMLMGTPAIFVAKTDVKQNASPDVIAFIPGQVDHDQLQTVIMQVVKQ